MYPLRNAVLVLSTRMVALRRATGHSSMKFSTFPHQKNYSCTPPLSCYHACFPGSFRLQKYSFSMTADKTTAVLWTPTNVTRMDNFRSIVNEKHKLQLETYEQLYNWSVTSYPDFWETFWHFSELLHSKPYTQVVDKSKRIDEVPEWFTGSRLNFAENLLRYRDDRVALYLAGEKELSNVTYAQLYARVSEYAAALRKIGVQTGDRVVGYIHNDREAVEAMLAAASIGAIWSSTSVDFGVTGVLDRFRQVQPKVILAPAGVVYNGKTHNHLDKLFQVVKDLPQLSKVVILPTPGNTNKPDIAHIPNAVHLEDFLALGRESDGSIPKLEFEQLPFNHPLYIMYSSGTTGAPKCMVHSAGGTLIQHMKEHVLHADLGRDDVMMYYTTTGWMMWNWLVSGLAVGASIVLYDGSPLYPSPTVVFDLIDKLGITVLGTSPKWLAVLEEKHIAPANTHKLSTLRAILSTGSTLAPSQFDYVYNSIKKNLMLGSITGGTDIVSCFALSNPSLSVHRGEIQSRGLGMAVQCWSTEEKHVEGQSGELVCVKPFPSAPVYFWNDTDGQKYKNAYFNQYHGVWCHGDFCLINPETKGLLLMGRSDGTLNPNGVRFGSAEIYNIVGTFKEVEDSLCVPQFDAQSNERVILFLKMANGHEFNKQIVDNIKQVIRSQLSIRHVPAVFLPTTAIPYTINGKKVEIAVRQTIAGKPVKNTSVLADPAVLDLYRDIPQLQGY